MASNYPPGVTGTEPEIAGWPPCAWCGHEKDEHEEIDTQDPPGRVIKVCHETSYSYGGENRPCYCSGYQTREEADEEHRRFGD